MCLAYFNSSHSFEDIQSAPKIIGGAAKAVADAVVEMIWHELLSMVAITNDIAVLTTSA
ncbi:MAG: hypothetical protein ACR2PR_05910 [Pseudohongiellaceae bacterium]